MKLVNNLSEKDKALREYPELIKQIIALDNELKEIMARDAIPISEHKRIRELGDRKRELVRAASNIWGKGKKEGQGPAHA